MQVVSIYPLLYSYDADASDAVAISRETNDEIASMISGRPDRFSGLANLPMQDVGAAIAEMERAVGTLGLKGVMIDDTVNGRRFDDPEFLPFFQAAEQAGALVMFHQGGRTIVTDRIPRYHLPNTVGNLAERSLTFAHLVLGGVMDKCPDLKVLLCHGGGYIPYTIERIDDGWQNRPFVRANSSQPTQCLSAPLLLRHHHPERRHPSLPHRQGGGGPGCAGHRLARRHVHRLARLMAAGSWKTSATTRRN